MELKQLFDQYDTDGSGDIDIDELAELMRSMRRMPKLSQLADMIRRHDGNDDGVISFPEFVELASAGELPRELTGVLHTDETLAEVQRVFNAIDEDGSGNVDIDELAAWFHASGHSMKYKDLFALLDEFDVDRDGKIDFSEFLYMVASQQLDPTLFENTATMSAERSRSASGTHALTADALAALHHRDVSQHQQQPQHDLLASDDAAASEDYGRGRSGAAWRGGRALERLHKDRATREQLEERGRKYWSELQGVVPSSPTAHQGGRQRPSTAMSGGSRHHYSSSNSTQLSTGRESVGSFATTVSAATMASHVPGPPRAAERGRGARRSRQASRAQEHWRHARELESAAHKFGARPEHHRMPQRAGTRATHARGPAGGQQRPSMDLTSMSPAWKHTHDVHSHTFYYRNRITNDTSTTKPEEIAQDLGDGWTQYTNLDGGRAYFHNRFSGKSQLHRPDPSVGHAQNGQYW